MEKKVLVIDDVSDIREAIAEAISGAGYEVKTAENGQVGLDIAYEWKPDLIMLDLVMPLVDGHETLRRLRQDPWGKDAKVIVLTAMDKPFDVAMAHVGDIEDYIIKAQNTLDEVIQKVRLAVHS